jgi:hypothetical protein
MTNPVKTETMFSVIQIPFPKPPIIKMFIEKLGLENRVSMIEKFCLKYY